MKIGFGKAALMGLGCAAFWSQATFASESGAAAALRMHEQEVAAFKSNLNMASTLDAQREVWAEAPDFEAFGKKLLREIDGSWDQPWFLDYAPVLIEMAPEYAIQPVPGNVNRTPLSVIRDAAEKFHFNDEKIGRLVLALTVDTGPKTRSFIEKVEATHPSKQVQGQAAMALALLSRELGDGGGVARFKAQRLDWVKKAIIESNTVEYNGVSVGEMAVNFLYEITKLEKGMQAPELLGWNVSHDAMRLSDFRGKPVVLVFWQSRMEASEETLAFMNKLEARLGTQGVAVLGVAGESSETVRELVKSGEVSFKNWVDDKGELAKVYQVHHYPAAWVLDAEGKVQYRGVPGAFVELTAEALLK